jgi:hypothetical protein
MILASATFRMIPCGRAICLEGNGVAVELGSILEIKAGSLRTRFLELLNSCSDCRGLFTDWPIAGRHRRHDGAGETLGDTASRHGVGGRERLMGF